MIVGNPLGTRDTEDEVRDSELIDLEDIVSSVGGEACGGLARPPRRAHPMEAWNRGAA